VPPAVIVPDAAVTVILAAIAGDTVTLNGVEVVIPVAVALIDLGWDSVAFTSTIGTLEATPLVKDTLVAVPKLVLLTVG